MKTTRTGTLYRYSLPLIKPLDCNGYRINTREGVLIHLSEGPSEGWGEVAPLPGFSKESLLVSSRMATTAIKAWSHKAPLPDALPPSAAFGMSCAIAELEGTLPNACSYQSAAWYQLGSDDQRPLLSSPTLKLKAGSRSALEVIKAISAIVTRHPTVQLRLDANRAWDYATAVAFAKGLPKSLYANVQFFEEPCQTAEASLQFAETTGLPIAWDESFRADPTLLRRGPCTAVVIKPSLTGDMTTCSTIVKAIQQQGLLPIISSSIESSLGLTQLARFAFWITPETVPGLDTLQFMQNSLIRSWSPYQLPLLLKNDLSVVWTL